MVLLLAGTVQTGRAAEVPDPVPCSPCFIGQLKLIDNTSDATGKTKILADDLYFVDTDKYLWKAGKNDVTDGASIPSLFKPISGSFESDFLPTKGVDSKVHCLGFDSPRVFHAARGASLRCESNSP
jgi:hypothetical protein